MSRAVTLQRTFDDLALTQQGVVLEPLLQAISDFLDDHEGLITTIQGDLQRGLKNPDTGRKGLTARQILRSLVLMCVKNWDYRELRNGSPTASRCDGSPISIASRCCSCSKSIWRWKWATDDRG